MKEEKEDIEAAMSSQITEREQEGKQIEDIKIKRAIQVLSDEDKRDKAKQLSAAYQKYYKEDNRNKKGKKAAVKRDDLSILQGYIIFIQGDYLLKPEKINELSQILSMSKNDAWLYIEKKLDSGNMKLYEGPEVIVFKDIDEKKIEEDVKKSLEAYKVFYDKKIKGTSKVKMITNQGSRAAMLGYIFMHKIMPLSEKRKLLAVENKKQLLKYIKEVIGNDELLPKFEGSGLLSKEKKNKTKPKRIILGYGITVDEPYKFLQFGNYVIPKKLLDKNYFSLRYPERTKKQVEYFTNKLITPNFRNLILEITINKTSLNKIQHLYDELDEDEKELFDNALSFSKLTSKEGQDYYRHKSLNDKQKTQIIARFKLLRGSVMAGNNSEDVIKELKIILLKMISNKMISQKDASDMMIYLLSI